MSKIALTPNPSGTGVFTIASPATSTDRTLTLPDEAGTVLTSASSLASANLTGTVTVSGANVGIGTSSPSTKLHLGGTAPMDSIIRQDSTVSGTNWEIGERTAGNWQIWEDDGDSVVATFQSNGNVGIGTTAPAALLDLKHNSASTHLRLTENTSGNWSALGVDTSDNLRIYANNTERMRIHDSGGLSFANTTDVGPYNTVLGYRNNHFTGQRSNTVGAGATSTMLTLYFGQNGAAIVRVVSTGTVVTYNYFANVYEYFVTCRDGTVTATLKQSQIGGGAGSFITTSTSAATFNVIQTSDAGLATVHDTAVDVLAVSAYNAVHATTTITMAANN